MSIGIVEPKWQLCGMFDLPHANANFLHDFAQGRHYETARMFFLRHLYIASYAFPALSWELIYSKEIKFIKKQLVTSVT